MLYCAQPDRNGYDIKDYSNEKILYVLKDITLHSHASYLELINKYPYFLKLNHKIKNMENLKKMLSFKNFAFFLSIFQTKYFVQDLASVTQINVQKKDRNR